MIIQKWRHFTLKQDNSYKSNIPWRKEHQLIYIIIPFHTCICNVISIHMYIFFKSEKLLKHKFKLHSRVKHAK